MAYDALPTFSFNTNHRSLSLGWPQSRVSWGTLFRAPCGAKACRVLLCFGVALLLPGRDNTSDDRMTLLCVRVRPPVIPPCNPPPSLCRFAIFYSSANSLPQTASRQSDIAPAHEHADSGPAAGSIRFELSDSIRFELSFPLLARYRAPFLHMNTAAGGNQAPCLQPTSPVSKSPVTHFVCRWRHSGS